MVAIFLKRHGKAVISLFRLSKKKEFPKGVPHVQQCLKRKSAEKSPEYWFRRTIPQELPGSSKIVFAILNRSVGEAQTVGEVKRFRNYETYRGKVRLDAESIEVYDLNPVLSDELRSRTYRQLSKKEYEAILSVSTIKQRTQQKKRITQNSRKYASREKSKEHRLLEQNLRRHPEILEQGLRYVDREYRFPTGDRIDLLMKDRRNRFVAVEIEPHVREGDFAGLLQALKYRHMFYAYNQIEPSKLSLIHISEPTRPY